jgi:hypothetical protein
VNRPSHRFSSWKAALVLAGALGSAAPVLADQAPVVEAPPPQSRQEEIRRLRAAKAAELRGYLPGKIERGLVFLETGGFIQRLFTPPSGFFPYIGGITPGGGAAGGPGYRHFGLFNGRATLVAYAAGSIKSYWIMEGVLAFPRLANGRLFADVRMSRADFPQEDFYGLGPDSAQSDRTSYDLRTSRAAVSGGVRLMPWLAVGQRIDYSTPRLRGGGDPNLPSTSDLFQETDAPGLGEQPDFMAYETYITGDYRSPGPNARRGGFYYIGYTHFDDMDFDRYGFDRLHVDVQQYLPFLKGHRVLALRAAGTFTDASDQEVPFYLMPWLGGSHMVRAFPSLRFRDRNMLLLQAEYRWEVLPFLMGAVFFDAGTVQPERRDIVLGDLKTDYGIGIRWGGPFGVFFRTDFAIGGDSGTRFLLRFNNAF